MGSIITSDLVPIEIRGTYQSYINIIYGVGSALGAATGGAIADSLGWRWEFGFQVPFLFVCLLLGILTVPRTLGLKEGVEHDSLAQAMKKFDYKGSLLLTLSVTTLILGLVSSLFHMLFIPCLSITRRILVEMCTLGHIQLSYL
jgi:MFS family permease